MSVWLTLSDGALVAVHLPVAELLARAHTIEPGTAAVAAQATDLFLRRIAKETRKP